MQPDYSKLDPELQDKIKKWQENSPANKQIQALTDLGDMVQEIVTLFDEQKEASKKSVDQLGATLLDIREKLTSLDDKEDPEEIDYSKPIVEAVKKMQKSLEDSIKGIEVKPEVKVSVPDVVVPDAPEVDLSALEKIIKTEIPEAFEKAIKLIPTTPAVELTPLEQAIRETHDNMMEMLQSIDTASRMKPQFPVSQLNDIKAAVETTAAATTPTYGIQAISDDGTYKYFFFEDNDANYYILRKHKTNKVFTYTAGTGGYSAVYVDKDNGPSGSPTWGTRGETF